MNYVDTSLQVAAGTLVCSCPVCRRVYYLATNESIVKHICICGETNIYVNPWLPNKKKNYEAGIVEAALATICLAYLLWLIFTQNT